MNNTIDNKHNSESSNCPVYFCDQFYNPTNGNIETGSYCYSNTPSKENKMVAYRYDTNGNIECQKYNLGDNVIVQGKVY